MDEPRTRRVRILDVSPHLLLGLFTEGVHNAYAVVRDALPADARLVAARFDPFDSPPSLRLMVESEEFGPVADGCVVPEIRPSIAVYSPPPTDVSYNVWDPINEPPR